jgi:putative hydrolase of the HAD superfamily
MQTISEPIRNIIFDFGGVLLDIDYRLTYAAMSDLLGLPKLPEDNPVALKDILIRYEKGEIGTESFIWTLQRTSKKEIPHGDAIIRAWNAMLLGWNVSKFNLLEQLQKKYDLFLLSNTNALHISWVHQDLKTSHNIHDFEKRFFKKVYYSHEVGMRKPDREIYQFVTTDANVIPEETLFIDDLPENLLGALNLGWNVYHHNPNDNLEEILRNTLKLL